MDQWDWKPNAPEFVPGALSNPGAQMPLPGGMTLSAIGHGGGMSTGVLPGGMPSSVQGGSGYPGPFSMPPSFGPVGPSATQGGPNSVHGTGQQGPPLGGPMDMPGPCAGTMATGGVMPPSMSQHPGDFQAPNHMMHIGAPPGVPASFNAMGHAGPRPGVMGPGTDPGMSMSGGSHGEEAPLVNLRAQYEWQIHNKDQKLRDLQKRLSREELERVQMQADFERDRRGLMHHLNQLVTAVERYGIPVEGEQDVSQPQMDANPGVVGGSSGSSSATYSRQCLDSKMEQLNNLLQEREERAPRGKAMGKSNRTSDGHRKGGGLPGGSDGQRKGGVPLGGAVNTFDRLSSSSSKSGPPGHSQCEAVGREPDSSVVPPDASASIVATSSAPVSRSPAEEAIRIEVDRMAHALEEQTENVIDQQARHTLEALPASDAREALRKVSELVTAQGGRCSNLSSVLQAVCRKIRRRSANAGSSTVGASASVPSVDSAARASDAAAAAPPPPPLPPPPPPPPPRDKQSSTEARGGTKWRPEVGSSQRSEGSARNIGESDLHQRHREEPRPEDQRPPSGPPGSSDSRETKVPRDFRDGGREGARESARSSGSASARRSSDRGSVSKQGNYWSTARFEQLAKQGAFDLKRLDESTGIWGLKLWMNELEPPMTDEDMQVYCRWLHHRLHKVRDECGLRSLRQIRTEVNFSKNGLGDDALGRLLQALQRSELHVVSLNFFANRLGPAGAHHVFDFLWSASFPVLEIHLSHNEIDDESALELMRVLSEHPKYQPRRVREGAAELQFPPVWLRLNNNLIRHPGRLLRTLEGELGVTFCLARNRHACGPNKCGHRGLNVPLVHLYTFETQDDPNPSDETPESRSMPQRREMQPLHRQLGERGEYSSSLLPRQRRWTASMPALPESPGSPSSSSGSPRPNSRGHAPPIGSASVASAIRRAATSAPGQLVAPQSIAAALGPDQHYTAGAVSHVVEASLMDADSIASQSGSRVEEATSGGPETWAHVQVARPPSAGNGAQPGTRRVASKSTVGAGGTTGTSGGGALRGVPEVTPEPDGQVASSAVHSGHRTSTLPAGTSPPPSSGPGSRATKVPDQVADEEEEVTKPTRPPKLLAPPKILQRGAKQVGPTLTPAALVPPSAQSEN